MKKDTLFFAKQPVEGISIQKRPDSLLGHFFDTNTFKALLTNCLRVDIASNNVKASIIKKILPPEWRKMELGTGTNRIAFQHAGMAVLIALDRRGLIDSLTEYKRSNEVPQFVARTYESNGLLTIQELVTPMSKMQFSLNEEPIREILNQLSGIYLFNDIGYTTKNFCNWGYRPMKDPSRAAKGEKEICCLDYGYMYPLAGQPKELFICPRCGAELVWNRDYTNFMCSNATCRLTYSPTDIWRKMDTGLIEKEDELLHLAVSGSTADYVRIESILDDIYEEV